VLERANKQPSGSAPSAAGHRFGTCRLRELVAVRGEAGLWLADDDDDGETLVRLYPGLPRLEEWHTLELAASQLVYAIDARLVPIREIALDVWPRLSFSCPGAEPLARRVAREPLSPAEAVAMCADVTAALAALGRAGVPPVDISPADVVLVDEQARLLVDVGLPGGQVARACVDLDHVAPERAAAIADRAQGIRAAHPGAGSPTAESMTYALASIVTASIRGPQWTGAALPPRLEQVLRRGLAHNPSERYATPAALVAALCDALGVPLGRRRRSLRRPAKPEPRGIGIAIPAVVLLLAAAAIGTVAGSATTSPDPPAEVTLAGAGLSVQAPRGWLDGGADEALPGIGTPALSAHPPGRSSETALIVMREAAPLLAQVADATPEPVRLGDDEAWRYRDVAVDAESTADVYLLEDGDGPVVAACLGPASVREGCAAALTTLSLSAGEAVALGGDVGARLGLARVVDELDRTRGRERRALAAAETGRAQAAAADRLAAAYTRAAQSAGRAGTVGKPGDLPRLIDRLEQTGRTYTALATAARATRRTAYAQARERILAQERALQKDLEALASTSSS